MLSRALMLAAVMAAAPVHGVEISRVGDLEMHCAAAPTTELTPEAAKSYMSCPG